MDERITEIKQSAVSYLKALETELPKFILELRKADTRRLGMLGDIMEGVKWLLDAHRAMGEISAETIERVSDALSAMEGALLNLDYTLIADILEYEIEELAADWRCALA